MGELRPGTVRPSPLDAAFPDVRARLDALEVALPVEALYREERIAGRRRERICIAPHGGGIEPWTRFLARWVQERVDCDYWSAWAEFRVLLTRGIALDVVDRTCKLLHVTSHRIWDLPVLYRELQPLLAERGERYAFGLAVHGKADDAPDTHYIEVGGTSPARDDVCRQLGAHGLAARPGAGGRAGRHPRNIVNVIARESIQVEIPRSYRRNPVFGHAIMQAMCDTLAGSG